MLAQQFITPLLLCEIVYIPESFIFETRTNRYKFEYGNQFASLYIENCMGLWLYPEKNQIQKSSYSCRYDCISFLVGNKDRDESNIFITAGWTVRVLISI